MSSAREHYVTLFDSNFLASGLCLYRSLERHSKDFVLWVLCLDSAVAESLERLALPRLRTIRLAEVETPQLARVRGERTRAEYCWTLTPFTFRFVFERDPTAPRVTYLDADLFFFEDPGPIFAELEGSGAEVLITEHAYAPEYDRSRTHGIYCVQFVTAARSAGALEVLGWWQDRCLEWCYDRVEDGKFGDQKYLDEWPSRFPNIVHVFGQKDRALAPWNATFMLARNPHARPIFFHFHRFRIVAPDRFLLYRGYRISGAARPLYDAYSVKMVEALEELRDLGLPIPTLPESPSLLDWLKRKVLTGMRRIAYARFQLQREQPDR